MHAINYRTENSHIGFVMDKYLVSKIPENFTPHILSGNVHGSFMSYRVFPKALLHGK